MPTKLLFGCITDKRDKGNYFSVKENVNGGPVVPQTPPLLSLLPNQCLLYGYDVCH